MLRKVFRLVPALALLAVALVWVMSSPTVSGQASPMPSLKAGDWPMYTAALNGSKYSPLDQIGATNFSKLEMAWQFKTDNLGNTPESKLQGAPIAIRGTLFTTAGQNGKSVVSLDGKTGELLWVHRYPEGERATRWSPRRYSGRGVAYWTDGKGDERIVYITTGYQLIELNAKTGQPIASFGKNGVVDLKVGVYIGNKQVDVEKGEIAQHAPPVVVGDVILVGSSMFEGLGYNYSTNVKGVARAYDAKTGKMLWRFDTIPKPGEFGNDTWENGSWEWTGNNGIWAIITVDPEAGLVYLPVETPTIDEYGGNRPGDNLFAESLVCVDLKTGKRKWHFQLVHHPLWDHDISSAPLLIDATIDGKPRKLVAQPTKQGWLYTFDRITGQPIWPIEERPVPASDVPFEKAAKTQPFVTKPPAYSPNYLATDRVIDFTPALRQRALENLKAYRWEQTPFIPPAYTGPGGKWQGAINIGNTGGGVNWPGASFDPETAIFYAQAGHTNVTTASYSEAEINRISPAGQTANGTQPRKPRWEAEPNYGARGGGRGGGERGAAPGGGRTGGPGQGGAARGGARGGEQPAAAAAGGRAGGRGLPPEAAAAAAGGRGGGRGGLGAGLEGLPVIKPPYGVLAAIDMNNGTMKFMVPHGDTPDAFKQTFQKLGINYPEKTGQGGSTGLMVTKTMVVVPDLQPTTGPGRTAPTAMLRAYDKQTGKEIGAIPLPGRASGTPMTYMVDGRQYINIAIGGIGTSSGTYVTYALPMSEIRPAGPAQ